jgi:CcmD family protein
MNTPKPTTGRTRCAILALLGASLLLLVLGPEVLAAQGQAAQPGEGPRQMRHFWHVFAAYGIAWLLVFGWAVSIARRLARVEETLGR